MIEVILNTGESKKYPTADEVKTEQREYLIYSKNQIVAQVPRENVKNIEYSA